MHVKVKVAQSCQTLYRVRGILQARTLEWIAFPFSRGSFQPSDGIHISYISCTGGRCFPLAPPEKPYSASTELKCLLRAAFRKYLIQSNDHPLGQAAVSQCHHCSHVISFLRFFLFILSVIRLQAPGGQRPRFLLNP